MVFTLDSILSSLQHFLFHKTSLHSLWLMFTLNKVTLLSKSAFLICISVYNEGSSIWYVPKILRNTNISYPLIRTRSCAYQGVTNFSFPENFTYVLNG